MYFRLFLTGADRYRKTDLLIKSLFDLRLLAGGYLIVSLERADGTRIPGMLTPREAAGASLPYEPFCDAAVDNAVVFCERFGRAVEDVREKKLGILAPIGGVELKDPEMKRALFELLGAEIPCVGILSSMKDSTDLQAYKELEDQLRKDPQTLLLDVDGMDRQELIGRIRGFAENVSDWANHQKFDPLERPRFRYQKKPVKQL